MAIPDFQEIMLPLLQLAADGNDHAVREAIDNLGRAFKLSNEECRELLPSGFEARFDNRVHWARSYLKQAGLLQNPARGSFRITDDGRKVLDSKPKRININFLMQFPKFMDFRNRSLRGNAGKKGEAVAVAEAAGTTKEILEECYQKLRNELAGDLLEAIRQSSPRFFENLVVDLLVKMGYGGSRKEAARVVGGSGDGGIDGIINEDRLGLDVIYVQAKRWDGTVGEVDIRNFVGSLSGRKASRGVFITASSFTKSALEFVARIKETVILIDGEKLAQLMIEHGVGVSKVASYEIGKVDADYFSEE
ncbi:MAG: restriction endonuclease [Elusimicrobia bacterium]|nr:restriction endonuclease [Elusimicrobiota bacterium]